MSISTGKPSKKTVFDIDDTSWPLGRIASNLSGIPYNSMVEFQVLRNPLLTKVERQRLSAVLHDPATYRRIEFYPNFDKIMSLEEYGAELFVNSNSFSQEINGDKMRQVLKEVPSFPESHMWFGVVNDESTGYKKIDDDTYILVDDSPYTIATSPARYNIVPEMPWNQTQEALEMMRNCTYVFVPAGDMERIYAIIRYLLSHDNDNP